MMAALLVGVMLAAMGIASPAAAATPAYCRFAVFIGVRGTDAPAGVAAAHNGRVWTGGGMGPQIDVLVTQFKKLGYPTYFASLNYPAGGGTGYAASVAAGVKSLVEELNWLAGACGKVTPAVVLAGHSQGAHVILDALGWASWPHGTSLTDNAKHMVRAAAVFGDPTYLPSRKYNAPSSPKGKGLFPRNLHVAEWLEKDFSNPGWPMGASKPGTVYRIRSYCLAGDAFCQSDLSDSTFTVHNSYKSKSMIAARDWIDYMLSSNN